MRRPIPFVLASILFIVSLYFSAFQQKDLEPIQQVKNQYVAGLQKTQDAIDNLIIKSRALSDKKKSIEELRNALIETRLSYKSIEFLAAKVDPIYIKNNINGAPLPSLEPKVPVPTRLDPIGLQVLDEMIFADEVLETKSEIITLSTGLKSDFDRFAERQKKLFIYDRTVFTAIRTELVRIFTLGITGFDTPASGNAMPEAKTTMISIREALTPYTDYFNGVRAGLGDELNESADQAIAYIEQNMDFDSFDRLTFYRDYIRPLDKLVLEAHKKSGIELPREYTRHVQSVVYENSELFSEDYLNPYFYTRLTESDDNPEIAELGKTLFYDPVLSVNNERSCASCHKPEMAFTDGAKKSVAKDFLGSVDRNAPTLLNTVYADRYFHDMRAFNLEVVLEHVVTNREEFSLGLIQLEEKLKKSKEYQEWFDKAFKNSQYQGINAQSITAAMTSYLKTLNTFDSEFDKYVRAETASIDESVRNGFNLFMGKAACGTCHFAPVFNGTVPPEYHESESEILGTPEFNDPENMHIDPDEGRYRGISKEKVNFYRFSFKTPTVRNVELTAPYMHNGVYTTLEEVMDFYNKGGGEGLGYEVPNQTLPFDNLNLTNKEQGDIIAFMRALTDTSGTTSVPVSLPSFENNPEWNERIIGGVY